MFSIYTTNAPAVNVRATTGAIQNVTCDRNVFHGITGDAMAIGTTSTTAAAAETVLNSSFRDNKGYQVLRRLLILNNPDDVVISGNITDSGCGTGLAGARGVIEFWNLAATPAVNRVNFVNNVLNRGTITRSFTTSQTGDGGATAAIGSGGVATYTNFSHNYVGGGFNAADVATPSVPAQFHFNEDNT